MMEFTNELSDLNMYRTHATCCLLQDTSLNIIKCGKALFTNESPVYCSGFGIAEVGRLEG
jgi:hypothetical protein